MDRHDGTEVNRTCRDCAHRSSYADLEAAGMITADEPSCPKCRGYNAMLYDQHGDFAEQVKRELEKRREHERKLNAEYQARQKKKWEESK